MIRILLLADHKWRDVSALALVKVHLEHSLPDADIRIISFDLHQAAVELFKPHILVIPHCHGKRNQDIADTIRRRNGVCVILPTEGRPNTEGRIKWAVEEWPHRLCDLYLCWSDTIRDRFQGTVPAVPAVTTGCPRFDFYYPPYNVLIKPPDETKELLGLKPGDKVITFASSYPQAKFTQINSDFNVKDWKDLRMTTTRGQEDPALYARREWDAFTKFQSLIPAVKNEFSEYKIVIKPHPSESAWMWEIFCYTHDVILMRGDHIWNLLAISSCHISRTDCLTAAEAGYFNLETLVLSDENTGEDGPGRELSQLVFHSDLSDSLSRQLGMIEHLLLPKTPSVDAREPYNKKWLTPGPEAAKRIAEQITNISFKKFKVDDPTFDDLAKLEIALKDHDTANFYPKADWVGHFNKTVRRADVDYWVNTLRDIINV